MRRHAALGESGMHRLLRIVTLAGIGLLGGCNMVISQEPWFAADAAGPRLKQGLWANLDAAGCTFDADKPVEEWPECAEPMFVRGDDYILRVETDQDKAPEWQTVPHLVVAGTPLIDQIEWRDKDRGGERAKRVYLYTALAATGRDADGTITATRRWLVQCGPLDQSKESASAPPRLVTSKPFPELKLDGASNCTAVSADAVRGAARLSEAIATQDGDKPVMGRWVREETR